MISYKDLGLLILFLIAAGLGIFLFIALNYLISILKKLRGILDKHESNIDKTLDRLPSIAGNVDEAAVNVKQGVEKTAAAVNAIGGTLTETVTSVTEGTQEAVEYMKIITEIVKVLISTFAKK